MHTITLTEDDCLDDEVVASLEGTWLDDRHFTTLVRDESTRVIRPDGSTLLTFVRHALPPDICAQAYPAIRKAAVTTDNRGAAGGVLQTDNDYAPEVRNARPGEMTRTRFRNVKQDGTLSKTNYARTVQSGILGYFDRVARFPFCRQTAFNAHQAESFRQTLPFIQAVNNVFRAYEPERWAAQAEITSRTSQDFVISGTVFTTLTVNRNWQTAVHTDRGDYKAGFGVLTTLRAGQYGGCYFTFPKYRVAVDMRTTDVLLADVHEYHGNTPLHGRKGAYERISCVFYYRSNMVHCGSAQEELERAKRRQAGEKLNPVNVND